MTRFCERRRITPQSFYRWRKLLGAPAARNGRAAGFVEVAHGGREGGAIAVELECGSRVLIPPGFDEPTLLGVLVRLASLPGDPGAGREAAS